MGDGLEFRIGKQEAIQKASAQMNAGFWKRLLPKRQLISIEQMWVPCWCFDYKAFTHTVEEGMEGKIAIEPLSETNAILPEGFPIQEVEAASVAIGKETSMEEAKKVIYWELFSREKRREKISVEIINKHVLYIPYWVVYVKDRSNQYDITAVDGLNGKVDLPLKQTLLSYLMGQEEGLRDLG
ncbi:hypothetical protein IMZ31_05545 [Pontibacillus sp. ALD_SL1]|uniref:hypothetical protein n=1 Tax=Pontibacillus sp. ALD_SL1 TaxID=2777185 RepID=UPI001A962D13|nr:hypothetical protein [Pontibacillus sp. ALD_SL1]QST01032.1 hypothetical protein IMZ31_05545 [Pontibacillus sp. ALD_SL1]